MKTDDYADPDDMFADTRMTFGEHIEDLRTHLMRAIKGFVVMMLLSFLFASQILHFITAPVDEQLKAYYDRYYAAREKKLRKDALDGHLANVPVIRQIVKLRRINRLDAPKQLDLLAMDAEGWEDVEMVFPDPIALAKNNLDLIRFANPETLKSLSIQEPFVVFFKVSIGAGFVLSSPWVFFQIWSFVAAGLYPHEKRLVNVYLPLSLFLFLAGAFICEFFVIPKAIAALLWFNELLDIQPDLRLNEWLGFAIFMPLVFGLSFQTPLIMLFTFMVGLFDVQTFKEKRKVAIISMAIFSAVITPSTDAVSMLFMLIPMCLLYELGIWLCWLKGREEDDSLEREEEQELVEV